MPKRRSVGKSFRVNTKGPRITSVSAGGGGFRVNVGGRGTRVTVRNPITGQSSTLSGGGRRKGRRSSPSQQAWVQKTGVQNVVIPFGGGVSLTVKADLKQYTYKRLVAIEQATAKGDLKKQSREFFRIVTSWDLETSKGKTMRRDVKALKQLPDGFALAVAIEIGNRTGVIAQPIDSGIGTGGGQKPVSKDSGAASKAKGGGCLWSMPVVLVFWLLPSLISRAKREHS